MIWIFYWPLFSFHCRFSWFVSHSNVTKPSHYKYHPDNSLGQDRFYEIKVHLSIVTFARQLRVSMPMPHNRSEIKNKLHF